MQCNSKTEKLRSTQNIETFQSIFSERENYLHCPKNEVCDEGFLQQM